MAKDKILILATTGLTTDLLCRQLQKLNIEPILIVEDSESKTTILKRRFKKLGFFKTLGQVAFMLFSLPFIAKRKERIKEIIASYGMKENAETSINLKVTSIHQESLLQRIKSIQPDLVIINGTRILKKDLLKHITCPIVNIHVGITPKYRGVHGGYWAVAKNDKAHFGVTLHFVDSGIDTGQIIAQSVIHPDASDNFKTYPILQYCEGLKLLSIHFNELLEGNTETIDPLSAESKLYYHPTIWSYLRSPKHP